MLSKSADWLLLGLHRVISNESLISSVGPKAPLLYHLAPTERPFKLGRLDRESGLYELLRA